MWPAVILLGGIGLLCLAAGISFLFQGEEAAAVAQYPIISSLVFLLPGLFFFLRQGKFTLTTTDLTIGRRIGGTQTLPLDTLGEMDLGMGKTAVGLTIKNPSGGVITRMNDMAPSRASFAIWAMNHYKGKLPDDVLMEMGKKHKKMQSTTLQGAVRTMKVDGKGDLQDHGFAIEHQQQWYYLPVTKTQTPGAGLLDLVLPVSVTTYLKTPGIPEREWLQLDALADAIFRSKYDTEEKIRLFRIVVETHQGSIIHNDQRDADGNLYEQVGKDTKFSIQVG